MVVARVNALKKTARFFFRGFGRTRPLDRPSPCKLPTQILELMMLKRRHLFFARGLDTLILLEASSGSRWIAAQHSNAQVRVKLRRARRRERCRNVCYAHLESSALDSSADLWPRRVRSNQAQQCWRNYAPLAMQAKCIAPMRLHPKRSSLRFTKRKLIKTLSAECAKCMSLVWCQGLDRARAAIRAWILVWLQR